MIRGALRIAAYASHKLWDALDLYRDLKDAYRAGKWQLEALEHSGAEEDYRW